MEKVMPNVGSATVESVSGTSPKDSQSKRQKRIQQACQQEQVENAGKSQSKKCRSKQRRKR